MALVTVSYAQLSVLVGAAQVVDAGFLIKRKGQISKGIILFSFFEYFWAGFSALELFSRSTSTPMWLPLSFIVWIVVGVASGFVVRATTWSKGIPPVIPTWIIIGGGMFGLYFLGASLWLSVVA
jgi:hypothetical protein